MSVALDSKAAPSSSGKMASLASRMLAATARNLDWLIAIALVVAITRPTLFVHGLSVTVPHPNLVDDSWQIDIAYKASIGKWLGRDVIFTFGPLYQLITSLPSRVLGFSVASFLAARGLPAFGVTIALTWATSKLLLAAESAWKRALFIVLIVVFWSPLEIRASTNLFFFALFWHVVDRLVNQRSRPLWAAGLCAVSLMGALMLSADTGLYSAAALFVIVMAAAALHWRSRETVIRLLLLGLLTLVGFAVLGVATNVILGGGLFAYRFLRDSYAIISSYRWFLPAPMVPADAMVAGCTAAIGFLILLLAWRWRDPQSETVTRRPLFLLSAPLFALIVLQSALVRSDWGHIVMGLFPVIFFALAVLLGNGTASVLRVLTCVFLAIGLTGMTAGPFPAFLPRSIAATLASYSFGPDTIPANCRWTYLDHVCFGLPDGKTLALTTAYLQQHTAVGDSILIFPYENEVGVVARRNVAGAVLQNYMVGGDYLTNRQLRGYESQRPPRGLYFVDGPGVVDIDEVTNFSRTPLIWFYMQNHYKTEAEVTPGVFALVRDDNRAEEVRQQSTALPGVEQSVVIATPQIIDLGPIRWPQDADFLKLRLELHYSPLWKLRKPARVAVELKLADGSSKRTYLAVPPNTPYDAWIFPWDEGSLGKFLDPLEANWRGSVRPPVVGVKIIIETPDWISMLPERVTVLGAEAVSLRQ